MGNLGRKKVDREMLLNRYHRLHSKVQHIEKELQTIHKECPERTSCYLRWGPWSLDYASGAPHRGDIRFINGKFEYDNGFEEWQHELSQFYEREATKLVRERDKLLAKMYRLASRLYSMGECVSLSWIYQHLRKPWFKR